MSFSFPAAKTAQAYEAEHGEGTFDPDYHFTGDQKTVENGLKAKVKDPSKVLAYHLYQPFPRMWSLEVMLEG